MQIKRKNNESEMVKEEEVEGRERLPSKQILALKPCRRPSNRFNFSMISEQRRWSSQKPGPEREKER